MERSIRADCASGLFFPGRRRDEPQTRINGRVIPIIRAVGVHPLRFEELDASAAKTMCLPCTGCDLNPHIDL
ncbi:MAG: hypothetical protein KJ729_01695 [Euryarchaeota archaeon]|nr:hypothetical protein [Euryarchaeota archaeon]